MAFIATPIYSSVTQDQLAEAVSVLAEQTAFARRLSVAALLRDVARLLERDAPLLIAEVHEKLRAADLVCDEIAREEQSLAEWRQHAFSTDTPAETQTSDLVGTVH